MMRDDAGSRILRYGWSIDLEWRNPYLASVDAWDAANEMEQQTKKERLFKVILELNRATSS